MAHRLIGVDVPEPKKQKQFRITMPPIEGKFGLSLFVGNKEYFIGVAIADVIKEQVVRKRMVKVPKGIVHVMPLSE